MTPSIDPARVFRNEGEQLPLARIHAAHLEYLQRRKDVVVFGAQAVNAYVKDPSMTQDVYLLSHRAGALAEDLKNHLSKWFHIAIRVRTVADGRGYRLFQVRKSGNRHLADIRQVPSLPPSKKVAKVQILSPPNLIAEKVVSHCKRRNSPKAGTDWRDLAMLLLRFPELKRESGAVVDCLNAAGASEEMHDLWKELVHLQIQPSSEEEEF